ncbi:hypothetical protein BU17DRAFT_61284 [Hysterangium stoloniferum]|nr:hypothetical protein BU17DRAFT_61284 [Hysterangium stoloniferum]
MDKFNWCYFAATLRQHQTIDFPGIALLNCTRDVTGNWRACIPPSSGEPSSFLKLDHDAHSGGWKRRGPAGVSLKYLLLCQIQQCWCHLQSRILEVVLTALFILELSGNVWLSHMTPKWKIFETTCQAIELYIIVLYILVPSFYERRRPERELDNKNVNGTGEKMNDISPCAGHPVVKRADNNQLLSWLKSSHRHSTKIVFLALSGGPSGEVVRVRGQKGYRRRRLPHWPEDGICGFHRGQCFNKQTHSGPLLCNQCFASKPNRRAGPVAGLF